MLHQNKIALMLFAFAVSGGICQLGEGEVYPLSPSNFGGTQNQLCALIRQGRLACGPIGTQQLGCQVLGCCWDASSPVPCFTHPSLTGGSAASGVTPRPTVDPSSIPTRAPPPIAFTFPSAAPPPNRPIQGTLSPVASTISYKGCLLHCTSVPITARRICLYDITRDICNMVGCCYDEAANQCFHTNPIKDPCPAENECQIVGGVSVTCGSYSKAVCEAVGCCYNEVSGVPKCYRKQAIGRTNGQAAATPIPTTTVATTKTAAAVETTTDILDRLKEIQSLLQGGSTTPASASGPPSLPAGLPNLPAGLPNLPAGLPNLPAGLPNLPAGLPNLPAGLPNLPAGLPNLPAGLPNLPGGIPTLPGGLPDLSGLPFTLPPSILQQNSVSPKAATTKPTTTTTTTTTTPAPTAAGTQSWKPTPLYTRQCDRNGCRTVIRSCLPAKCGDPPHNPNTVKTNFDPRKIVGGSRAFPFSHPWTVMIQKTEGNRTFVCGGTIICSRWVVTAAHCLDQQTGRSNRPDLNPAMYKLFFGRWYGLRSPYGRQVQVFKGVQDIEVLVQHEKFIPGKHRGVITHDIALIKLRRPVVFNDYVHPICLPRKTPSPGKIMFATGWGISRGIGPAPSTLKQLGVEIKSRQSCQNRVPGFINPVGVLCAGGEPNHDTCTGDSGGPLVGSELSPVGRFPTRGKPIWYFYGLTSIGSPSCNTRQFDRQPALYTNIHYFLNWIRTNTADCCS